MKNKKIAWTDLFIVFFVIRTWLSMTSIIDDTSILEQIFNIIIILLFIRILFNIKFKKRKLILILCIAMLLLICSYLSNNRIFFLAYLLIVVSKEVDNRKLIKILLITNIAIFSLHIIYYLICYFFSPTSIKYMIDEKGVRSNLFLKHPNYAGGAIMWILSGYIYIKKEKNTLQTYILIILCAVIGYIITKSRTSFIGYIYILAVLPFLNNDKFYEIFFKIIKYAFTICAIVTIFVITNYETYNFQKIDSILNGRYKKSYVAYNVYGSTFLGQKIDLNEEIYIKNKYTYDNTTLDSFYVACFINYGTIYLILISILSIKYLKKMDRKGVMFWGLYVLICMTEKYIMYAGLAFPIILLGKQWMTERK